MMKNFKSGVYDYTATLKEILACENSHQNIDPGFWRQQDCSDDRTFGAFIPLDSNLSALSQAKNIAVHNSGVSSNQLLICSQVMGLGATHLLRSIANTYSNRSYNFICISGFMFVGYYIKAKEMDKLDRLRMFMRSSDALLINELQVVNRYPWILKELLDVFDHYRSVHKPLVIATNTDALKEVGDGLLRFPQLLENIFYILQPDMNERISMLQNLADRNSVEMPDNVAEYLSSIRKHNVRELVGAFKLFHAASRFYKIPITLDWIMNGPLRERFRDN